MLSEQAKSEIRALQARYPVTRSALGPALYVAQREVGWLPASVLAEVAELFGLEVTEVGEFASFYHMFSLQPLGKHVIRYCESAPCHVVGGRQVFERLIEELNLQPQETSPDGKWTFITVSCLGLCGVAPVLVIDEDMYGNVRPDQIPDILSRYN